MAIPVISPTQSVLGYKQWEYFEFQPYASNSPTRWRSTTGLPSDLSFDEPARFAATGVDSTDVISCSGHPFVDGDQVIFYDLDGGSGIQEDTIYFVRDSVPETSFKVSASLAGVAVDLGSDISACEIGARPRGVISGRVTNPGVWNFGVIASNADGDSEEQQFTLGIEPGALIPDSLPWIGVDVVTGQLSVDGRVVPELTPDILAQMGQANFVPPIALAVKQDDDLLTRVSFLRGGTVQDISLASLILTLKQFEPEGELVVSSPTMEKQGAGTSTNFLLHSKFDGATLASALSDYEADFGTYFYALAEIQYEQINAESVGPASLIRSSATFVVRIERDLTKNED